MSKADMKIQLTFLLLFLIIFGAKAQGIETYQDQEIYKKRKVKLRKWYSGIDSRLIGTHHYDAEGRLVRYQVVSNGGETEVNTHFLYDTEGKLLKQVDTIKTGLPVSKNVGRLQKYGLDPKKAGKRKSVLTVEVAKYELTYEEGQLVKKIKYNTDGSLGEVVQYQYNGRIQDKEWYDDGKLVQKSTTKYIDDFHKNHDAGWKLSKKGEKVDWAYDFTYEFENGEVKLMTKSQGQVAKETREFFYNKKGLLVRTTGLTPQYFEYEFY